MPSPYKLSQLLSSINGELPDNTSRLISAADIRSNMVEIAESLTDIVGDTGRSYAATISQVSSSVGALYVTGDVAITGALTVNGSGGFESTTNKNQPNGYAGLDSSGNIVGPIIVRTGTAATIDGISLPTGEVAVCTDTLEIRIGNGTAGGESPRYTDFVLAASGVKPSGASSSYLDWNTRLRLDDGSNQADYSYINAHFTNPQGEIEIGYSTYLSSIGVQINGPGGGSTASILPGQLYLDANSNSSVIYLDAITGTIQMPGITTTERNALTPSDGWLIYNSTTGKFQGRASGAWVDLH